MVHLKTILIVCLLTAATAVSEPLLTAPAGRFDFGITPRNCVLTHTFWLHSSGTDTVIIENVKTGCACAVSEFSDSVLAPGDSTSLSLQWDVSRYRGSVYRAPMINYNGPHSPLRVSMQGQLSEFPDSARPVSAKPYRFELSRAAIKDRSEVTYSLVNHSDSDYEIELISPVPDQVEIEVPESVPANGSAEGLVRVKPDYLDSEFEASITFLIKDRSNSHITVPIRRRFY